ncbi:MAG: ABC transporter substrate-binding protein [Defluviitaleaceae bacterium]|nr:ABC transporter substrate-binding protein [Defluviitaleaceae bacterium]
MKRLACIAICALFVLTGCRYFVDEPFIQDPTPTPSPTPTGAPSPTPVAPREGGTLRLAMRNPLTLNPLLNEDITVDKILRLVFEHIAVLGDDMKPTGNLAELDFSTDYSFVTIKIRGEAVWGDGVPVSADDFLFTVDFIKKAPGTTLYKECVANFLECEILDDKTVRVTFANAFGGSSYSFLFPLIPRHYYFDETKPGSAKNMAPLGNGLYSFKEFTPLVSVSLARNTRSYRNYVYIDGIEVKLIHDRQSTVDAFDYGVIDALEIEITEWSRHQSVKDTNPGEFYSMNYEFIGFNHKRQIFRNKLFRHALAQSLDMDELISSSYLTHAERAYSPINPSSWLYAEDARRFEYNWIIAGALFERVKNGESDYVPGINDDEAELNAPPPVPALSVLTNYENENRVKIAAAIVETLVFHGFDAFLELAGFDEMEAKLASGDYDIFVGGYALTLLPDLRFAFASSSIGAGNIFNYDSPEFDGLLDALFSVGNESVFKSAAHEMQRYFAEELPVISIAFVKSALLLDTRIRGDIKPSPNDLYANINEWFILE